MDAAIPVMIIVFPTKPDEERQAFFAGLGGKGGGPRLPDVKGA
jgi:hypothetical protein